MLDLNGMKLFQCIFPHQKSQSSTVKPYLLSLEFLTLLPQTMEHVLLVQSLRIFWMQMVLNTENKPPTMMHPSSNGLAEKAVQIIKQGLKLTTGSLSDKLAKLIFSYHITPHSTTGLSPAESLMGRKLKQCFNSLKHNITTRVELKQQQQKCNHDSCAVARLFQEGDGVYAQDFRQGKSWVSGKIAKCLGPVSFEVLTDNGQEIRYQQDH